MIISLTGPSGAGKEYLKSALLHKFTSLKELCWTTTRSLRPGEIQGVTRECIDGQSFLELECAGELMFVQRMFQHSYGIRKEFLRSDAGYLLTEFHIENLVKARSQELYPVAIGLVPRNISFLRQRLERRATESVVQIADRIAAAEKEIAMIRQHAYLFSFLVEFTEADEHTVADKVFSFLNPKII